MQHIDQWHPGTCALAAMKAYKALESGGHIAIQRVEFGRFTGLVRVIYLADMPHAQVLEMLGEKKRALEAAEV